MEFTFSAEIYEVKDIREGLHVIRFQYMGGKGLAFSPNKPPDDKYGAIVPMNFSIRFSQKGTFLWTKF